jgi:hypothetical protein
LAVAAGLWENTEEACRRYAIVDEAMTVPSRLQEREHALRVLIEPGDSRRPREPKPRALGDEPTDVRVRVGAPHLEEPHRSLGIAGDVRPNAALGAEALRQLILRPHREVEVLEPALNRKDLS